MLIITKRRAMAMRAVAVWLGLAGGAAGVTVPSPAQAAWQQTNLRTFHHFGICTFTGCEHNDGMSPNVASAFAPTAEVNVTQWVLAAKAMGAGTAVLTARHEGGFALWPSKFSNYTIAQSPYRNGTADLVAEFVDACRAHGLKPGLYIAAGCNGYNHCGPRPITDPVEYVRVQVGMVTELVSGKYGEIEYLWFDHHGNPANSTSPWGPNCAHGCDPMSTGLWAAVDTAVAAASPTTLRGGADLNIGPTDPAKAGTPLWMACNTTDGTVHTRPTAFGPLGQWYRPSEITNMLTSSGWFHHPSTQPKPLAEALGMIWGALGQGYSGIFNAPPNTAGVLDDKIVELMEQIGAAMRGFWGSSVAAAAGMCSADAITAATVTLPPSAGRIKTVALREESLAHGQLVSGYVLEGRATATSGWVPLSPARETIGRLYLHAINPPMSLVDVRVRCTGLLGPANVSVNVLTAGPLDTLAN